MVYRVGDASVFSDALVFEVDFAVFIDGYIFQQGISLDSVIDVWFAFFVKVDDFALMMAFAKPILDCFAYGTAEAAFVWVIEND